MTKYKDTVGYVRFCWEPKCLNCLLNQHELMFVQVQMLSASEKREKRRPEISFYFLFAFSICFLFLFFFVYKKWTWLLKWLCLLSGISCLLSALLVHLPLLFFQTASLHFECISFGDHIFPHVGPLNEMGHLAHRHNQLMQVPIKCTLMR